MVVTALRSSLLPLLHISGREITLRWIETNGQASVLLSRGDIPIALATIDASAEGINQIMWIMRPSKLAATFS
jgi:hypothetical protein